MPKIALQRPSGKVVHRLEMAKPPSTINHAGESFVFQLVAPSGTWVYAQKGTRRAVASNAEQVALYG